MIKEIVGYQIYKQKNGDYVANYKAFRVEESAYIKYKTLLEEAIIRSIHFELLKEAGYTTEYPLMYGTEEEMRLLLDAMNSCNKDEGK